MNTYPNHYIGMDGFSKLVTYFDYSSNNRASTTLVCFCRTVEQYGLPSHVKCDYGVESIEVARYMIHNRGIGRSSVIT